MKSWKIKKTKTIIQDDWISLEAHSCETSNGLLIEPYYVLNPRDWVVIIAQNAKGEFIIEQQYRHGIQKFCFEFPAGNLEEGEDPLDCAQRELIEETGYYGGEWTYLTKFAVNSANHSNYAHFYFAKNVQAGPAMQADEQEELEVYTWTKATLLQKIQQGHFINPHHLAGWLRFALRDS
jgi:8-oxo-dGTP pyrophosphatase MutT (NUDIX family)